MNRLRHRKHEVRSGTTRHGCWSLSVEFILEDMWVGGFWKSTGSAGMEIRPGAPVKSWQSKTPTGYRTHFWQRTNWDLYVCLIPTVVFHYKWHLDFKRYP